MKRISWAFAVILLVAVPALVSAQGTQNTAIENPEAGAKFNEGNSLLRQGKYQEAIEAFTESARLEPNNYLAEYGLGLCFQRLRQANDAILHYDAAIRFNPNYFDAHYAKGNVYRSLLNDPNRAIESYQMAGDVSEQAGRPKADAFFNLGVALFEQQRFDDALAAFGKVTQYDPANERAFVTMGRIYQEKGDYENALINFSVAAQKKPTWFEPYYFQAAVLNRLGQYDGAINQADQALQRMPNHGGALYEKGFALKSLERWDEATTVLQQAARDAQWRQMANYQIELIKNRDMYVDIPPTPTKPPPPIPPMG